MADTVKECRYFLFLFFSLHPANINRVIMTIFVWYDIIAFGHVLGYSTPSGPAAEGSASCQCAYLFSSRGGAEERVTQLYDMTARQ